jgi:ABC-2 type transport system ATP-binding protein
MVPATHRENEPVASVRDVSKRYGRVRALIGFSTDLAPGEIVGLLGPNGAGKSTLMRILTGLVRQDSGTVHVLGRSMPRHRVEALAGVGALIEGPAFYGHLTGRRNLEILATYRRLRHEPGISEVLDWVELSGRADDPVGTYSVGMKRRLGLAAALLPKPRLLLLDEPTSGLDPEAHHMVEGILRREARERGATILLASHILPEVARTCDRVLVLKEGLLVGEGRPEDADRARRGIEVEVTEPARALDWLAGRPEFGWVGRENGLLVVDVEDEVPRLVTALVQAGFGIRRVAPRALDPEGYYLELLRRPAGGERAQ